MVYNGILMETIGISVMVFIVYLSWGFFTGGSVIMAYGIRNHIIL